MQVMPESFGPEADRIREQLPETSGQNCPGMKMAMLIYQELNGYDVPVTREMRL